MKKQDGYNLMELMIALTVGLIIIAATITICISTIKASADIIKSARLNHDLDSAMALMVNDIRRAGYWGGRPGYDWGAMVGSDARDNPFTQDTTNLYVSGNCILYTYDGGKDEHDSNGSVDTDEYYGFKLNGTNVQMRLSGSSTNNCNLDTDVWRDLNISVGNEQIEVTELTFKQSFKCLRKRVGIDPLTGENYVDQSYPKPPNTTYNGTCANAAATAGEPLIKGDRVIETREIDITLAGRVDNDKYISKKPPDKNNDPDYPEPYRVKIPNNRVFTQP